MKVDILYVAWNRLEFTKFSLEMLRRNTDWSLVNTLVVHDDGSWDGTAEYLAGQMPTFPVETRYTIDALRSPPAVMNRYVGSSEVEWFAKIDNDIVVPPGWLGDLAGVIERNPGLELLGMEAGRSGPPGQDGREWNGVYGWMPGSHIGGVGLMRVEAFLRHRKLEEHKGRFGFTEWQHEYQPVRGWVVPDLLVSSLDQVPVEPWRSLSAAYIEEGWQRHWPEYHERWDCWWSWWPK